MSLEHLVSTGHPLARPQDEASLQSRFAPAVWLAPEEVDVMFTALSVRESCPVCEGQLRDR